MFPRMLICQLLLLESFLVPSTKKTDRQSNGQKLHMPTCSEGKFTVVKASTVAPCWCCEQIPRRIIVDKTVNLPPCTLHLHLTKNEYIDVQQPKY